MTDDVVKKPKHYNQVAGVQPLDVIQALDLGFALGNAFKYLWRHRSKGGLEDIKKAIFYLQFHLYIHGEGPDPREDSHA